jgi:hypothetical protein
MKRLFILLAAVAAIASIVAGGAFAGTGSNLKSLTTGANGNGTSVGHISTSYTDYVFGPVSCSGVHQVKKGITTENETCTSTTGSPVTSPYAWGSVNPFGGGAWQSDYDHASIANSGSYTISADGMSYTIVANY